MGRGGAASWWIVGASEVDTDCCGASCSRLRTASAAHAARPAAFALPPPPLQAQLYTQLLGSGFLSDTERDVLRWGRNATGEPRGALLAPPQCKAHLHPVLVSLLLRNGGPATLCMCRRNTQATE